MENLAKKKGAFFSKERTNAVSFKEFFQLLRIYEGCKENFYENNAGAFKLIQIIEIQWIQRYIHTYHT